MSVGSNAVKVTAKTALRNNWVKVIAACLVLIFTVFISNFIASLISILTGEFVSIVITAFVTVFLTLPLILGVLRYIWRMLFSAQDSPIYIFYWFSSKKLYLRAMKFVLLMTVRVVMWLAIFNIPTFFLYIFSRSFIFEFLNIAAPLWTANSHFYLFLVENIAIICTVFAMLKYYIAPILFVANDSIEAGEAIHMSTVISKKSSVDFIFLSLSFFGWILLSFLVVPLVFTLPYMLTSYAVHIRFAVAEYNRHIKEQSQKEFNPLFCEV